MVRSDHGIKGARASDHGLQFKIYMREKKLSEGHGQYFVNCCIFVGCGRNHHLIFIVADLPIVY